jgi:hypothetical protein
MPPPAPENARAHPRPRVRVCPNRSVQPHWTRFGPVIAGGLALLRICMRGSDASIGHALLRMRVPY